MGKFLKTQTKIKATSAKFCGKVFKYSATTIKEVTSANCIKASNKRIYSKFPDTISEDYMITGHKEIQVNNGNINEPI